jgi:hypothetical protein
MWRLFSRGDDLGSLGKEQREAIRRRLREPGDKVWVWLPEVRMGSYGERYRDCVLFERTARGEIWEVNRKHYDIDDEDFIGPISGYIDFS